LSFRVPDPALRLLSMRIVSPGEDHHLPPKRRRLHRRVRGARARAILLLVACGVVAVGLMTLPGRSVRVADEDRETFEPKDVDLDSIAERDALPARPVYRYSVIPGGAYSASELAEAIDRDPVVEAAYRRVSSDGVHAEIVPADRLAYMSYRIGDQIYWTKHQVRLRRGETILTNGVARLRGRCGNGISVAPMLPTADSEPAPLELEALSAGESSLLPSQRLAFDRALATAPAGISLGFGLKDELGVGLELGGPFAGSEPSFAPGLFPGAPPLDSTPVPTGDTLSGAAPFPPDVPPIFPGTPPIGPPVFAPPTGPPGQNGGTGGDLPGGTGPTLPGGGPGGSPSESPTAPIPTPEPGTVLLVGGGAVMMALRRRRSRP
jgi:hypothetical protein